MQRAYGRMYTVAFACLYSRSKLVQVLVVKEYYRCLSLIALKTEILYNFQAVANINNFRILPGFKRKECLSCCRRYTSVGLTNQYAKLPCSLSFVATSSDVSFATTAKSLPLWSSA